MPYKIAAKHLLHFRRKTRITSSVSCIGGHHKSPLFNSTIVIRVGKGIKVPYIAIRTIEPSTIQIFSSTGLRVLIGAYRSTISWSGLLFMQFARKISQRKNAIDTKSGLTAPFLQSRGSRGGRGSRGRKKGGYKSGFGMSTVAKP